MESQFASTFSFKEVFMNIPELFGIDVFNDKEMKKRLSKEIYESLYNTIEQHKELDIKIANEVAAAMKEGLSSTERHIILTGFSR